MKLRLCQPPSAIAGMLMGLLLSWQPVVALNFEQQEVDPTKFIVLAAPLAQQDHYNLVILEQLADTQPCWQEQPRQPGVVIPLLLNFDFTNICGRSLNSKGYSIRQGGQDLASAYRLSLVKQDGVLVLMGTPRYRQQAPPLEIGRTQTLEPGFLKIELAPDWRLTKRTYLGRRLKHIYLTQGASPSEEGTPRVATRRRRRTRAASPPAATTPLPSSSASVLPPLTDEVEIPVPPPESARPDPRAAVLPPPATDEPPPGSDPLLVPSASIPLGNAGNEPDVFTARSLPLPGSDQGDVGAAGSPPPPPVPADLSRYRYRVLVDPNDEREQALVKDLIPDAFGVSHRGLWVLQVGAFERRDEADERIQLLQQHGFDGMIDIR